MDLLMLQQYLLNKVLYIINSKNLNNDLTTCAKDVTEFTTDVLASALTVNSTTVFKASSSYTGNLPSIDFKYGVFIVMVRGNYRFVLAQNPLNEIALNYYENGWQGWNIISGGGSDSYDNIFSDESATFITADTQFDCVCSKDITRYRFIKVTGYIGSSSSSNRFAILIPAISLDACYYPIVANTTHSNLRYISYTSNTNAITFTIGAKAKIISILGIK